MTSQITAPAGTAPVRRTTMLAGLAGIVWNAYGVWQFAQTAIATPEQLQSAGMTAEQAALMVSLPFWMDLSFAIGVGGGLAGSVLLALGNRIATPVLLVSLVAYVVLFAGDAGLGVFAAFGAAQVAILSLVAAIAAGLFILSARAMPLSNRSR